MSEPARKTDIDVADYERRLRPAAPRQDDPLAELARLVAAAPEPRKPQPVDALSPAARAALTPDEEDFLNELSLAIDRGQPGERREPASQPARDVEAISRAQAAVDQAAADLAAEAKAASAAQQAAAEVEKAAVEIVKPARPAPAEHHSAAVEIPALKAQAALRGGLDLGGLEEMTRLEDISRVGLAPADAPALPRIDLHAPVFPRPLTAQAAPAAPARSLVEPRLDDPVDPPRAPVAGPAAPRDLDAALPGDDGFETVAPVLAAARTPPPARSRRAMAAVVALVGVGLAATSVALTMKRGPRAASGEPPTILASSDPVKTAPPAATTASAEKADDLLARKPSGAKQDGAKPDAGARAVGKPEEPVDLAREAQKVVRTIPIAGIQDPAVPRTPTGDSANPDRMGSIFPEPRRVRTVSVRPDGTIVGGDPVPTAAKAPTAAPAPVAVIPPPPIASAPPPAPAPAPVAVAPATPAETPRAAPRPRPAAQTPSVTPAATPAPRRPAIAETPAEPKAEKPAPARRAAAPAPAAAPQPEAAEPVEQVRNPFANLFGRKDQPQAAPATTASTSAAAPAADDEDAARKPAARANVGSGSFAVQLSSSPSEGDARTAASRLGGRFASQLGGRSARVVKGEANGKTVYRVRAGGMSREGAVSACESIKSSGGSCFVAQD